MSFSSFDFLSPKITLNYNGHDSHASRIGGFLSLCYLVIICIIIFYCFWGLIKPYYYSSFIYEENINENKIYQKINFSGISHFIRIYSYNNDGYFGNIDNKNIIIYGIKENDNIYKNNALNLEDLSNTEHWLYDKCDKISDIYSNLFSKISNIGTDYSSFVCVRYYYNPIYNKYYEFGEEGYIEPSLETNNLSEKLFSYKIMIKKCFNNTLINNYMGFKCNSENEIIKYVDIYKEVFIYFTANKILPLKINNPFEEYFNSISSTFNKYSHFENNINFIPTKLKARKGLIIPSNKEILSYTLNSYNINEKLNNEEDPNLLGLFNLYLNNQILVYEIFFPNFLDVLSHIGGIVKIFFFIFEILNYVNNQYTIIENTKDLFKISSGIESNFYESKDITLDNMRHLTTKNYKLKQLNTNEEISRKNFSPVINKNKLKLPEPSPKSRLSCKKNNFSLYPLYMNSNKRNDFSKKNSFNVRTKDKRKSYLSQGYKVKSKDIKENSLYIKNQSLYENISNNEMQNSSNYNNYPMDNYSINNNSKENNIKIEPYKKSNNEFSPIHKHKNSRKSNLKLASNKHILDKNERNSHLFLRNQSPERHKSINYTNQKKTIKNSIFNKNYLIQKNSNEFINDSSKQMLSNNKNLLIAINQNKTQGDRNKLEENNIRGEFINNNTEIVNSTKNLNIYTNNNIDPSAFLKTLIKNKLKLEIPEDKDGLNQNTNILIRKINFFEFFKSLFICNNKSSNKISLIHKFRLKLLSEEHLYRNHINLYLIQKIFQIEESYKFDIKELYYNL
jgi:hypothetical protein